MKKMLSWKLLFGGAALLLFSFNTNPFPSPDQELNGDATTINGSRVVFTQVVQLEGENERPVPVETDAKGIAILRMTEDHKLYSRIMVHKLDPEDDGSLLFAHIHTGGVNQTGPPIVFLAHNISEFGVNMVQDVTNAQYEAILEDALYVNAHSTVYPAGIVRGQIR